MRIGNHSVDDMLRQYLAAHPFPSQRKDYLEPFRDYPSHHLQNASPEEAASFIVGYVAGHVRYCPAIRPLTDEQYNVNQKLETAQLEMALNRIRGRIADELEVELDGRNACMFGGTGRNSISPEQFLRITDIVATERIENSGGMCLAGARALKEFGCPHPVTVMNVEATLADGEAGDHSIIRIGHGPQAWIADPLMHHLNQPQRLKLLGFDCPSYWAAFDFDGKGNAARYLYLTLFPDARSDSRVTRLCRYDELLQTDRRGKPIHESVIYDSLAVERTPGGKITVRVLQ